MHTKGPWIQDDRTIITKDNYVIARVYKVTDHDADDDSETEHTRLETDANARLIAVAPELLEACKIAADVLSPVSHDSLDPTLKEDSAVLYLLQVIAKTEGR